MPPFAVRFRARYAPFLFVWQALARGETPESLPANWKSLNYYAHALLGEALAPAKTAAQTFLREVELARMDSKTYTARLTLASQTFAQTVCTLAGLAWEEKLRLPPLASPAPSPRPLPAQASKLKPKPPTRPKPKPKTKRKPARKPAATVKPKPKSKAKVKPKQTRARAVSSRARRSSRRK
jgi:outer membrane biosynthesis protein TonB